MITLDTAREPCPAVYPGLCLGIILLVAGLTGFAPAPAKALNGAETAVEQVLADEGPHSPKLYPVLLQLGKAQAQSNDHGGAFATFQRAQLLIHRLDGVYSPAQLDSLRHQISSALSLGNIKTADTLQHLSFSIAQRAYPDTTDEMTLARIRMANWLLARQRHEDALHLYELAQNAIESNGGLPARQVALLRAQALSLHLAGHCCGQERLLRANHLAQMSPQLSQEQRQQLALDYADSLMLAEQVDIAQLQYASLAKAYPAQLLGPKNRKSVVDTALKSHPDYNADKTVITLVEANHEVSLSHPAAVGNPVALCAADTGLSDAAEPIELEIAVTVNALGEAEHIQISGQAPNQLNRYLRRALRESRYRPSIDQQGQLNKSTLAFTQTFDGRRRPVFHDQIDGWGTILTHQTCQQMALSKYMADTGQRQGLRLARR